MLGASFLILSLPRRPRVCYNGYMICIGILEDEASQRQLLWNYLERLCEERGVRVNVELFGDSRTFLENATQYDILLLDIFLGDGQVSGFEVARRVREKDQDVMVIFITNLAHFALRGYSVNAFDFLIKPVDYRAFEDKLGRALSRLEARKAKRLTLRTRGGLTCLNVEAIRYVEVRGHGILFHTGEGTLETSGTMVKVENALQGESFFRCHVAYLVNLRQVDKVDRLAAIVGGEAIPISRHRRAAFLQALVDYLGGEFM